MEQRSEHFGDKDPLGHVVEAQARGLIASAEMHGTEIPGHWSAGADAARETAVILLILSTIFAHIRVDLGGLAYYFCQVF